MLTLGFASLLVEAVGRWHGGCWGSALTHVGALVYFSRLAVWLSARKRR